MINQIHNEYPISNEFRLGFERDMQTNYEKRSKPRINCDYPACVKGCDVDTAKFKEDSRLTNLSAGGLFMRVNRNIEYGSSVSVIIYLTSTSITTDTPKLSTKGTVVRTEPHVDGSCGVAVQFTNYRFL